MPLKAGDRLGPYEILGPLGKGGMGEVFRARDTQLDRAAAIKILPAAVAQDRERLARFEREAKVLASLNHANIAQVYGLAEGSGVRGIAMELVPGANIAGPLPTETVLDYARQIASALEAAHEKGIVHRDLKPANIMVTPDGTIKVLDFGLARFDAAQPDDASDAPTLMASPTQAGIILGTAGYMSPEQARGKPADKRADIWAFGVVLYEIVTGKQLFAGETMTDLLASVVREDPDLSVVPVKLRRLIRRCLEKDPKRRLRDIGDWADLLDDDTPAPLAVSPPSRFRANVWMAVGAIAAALAASVSFVHFRERPAPPPDAMRFQIHLPENIHIEAGGAVMLSPDGRHLAFPGATADGNRVIIQDLDGGAARVMVNTRISGESPPFIWSPDSASVAYSANGGTVSKVELATGHVDAICDRPGPAVGGLWNSAGILIVGSNTAGLWRVTINDRKPAALTRLDKSRGETSHQLPMFLPDGRHYLYFANASDRAQSAIFARSLDDAPEKPSHLVVSTEFGARFVAGTDPDSGWLLYMQAGALVAQPFDLKKLSLTGTPWPLPARVGTAYQTALFSASQHVLVYRSGGTRREAQLQWVNARTGDELGAAGDASATFEHVLSPDEKRVAYVREDEATRRDVWILDLDRNTSTRLTSGGHHETPAWSPDGTEIVYSELIDSTWQMFRRRADGSGDAQLVLKLPSESVAIEDWSRDGRFMLFIRSTSASFGKESLGALALQKGAAPTEFSLSTEFNEDQARFSPDGRYVAYTSWETGENEVYVRPFAPGGSVQAAGKWLISSQGGQHPEWSPDGRKLFWVSGGTVYAAAVGTTAGFHAGIPERLYSVKDAAGGAALMTTKGQGLVLKPVGTVAAEPITVLVNWKPGLKPK